MSSNFFVNIEASENIDTLWSLEIKVNLYRVTLSDLQPFLTNFRACTVAIYLVILSFFRWKQFSLHEGAMSTLIMIYCNVYSWFIWVYWILKNERSSLNDFHTAKQIGHEEFHFYDWLANFSSNLQSLHGLSDQAHLANFAHLVFVALLIFGYAEGAIFFLLSTVNGSEGGRTDVERIKFVILELMFVSRCFVTGLKKINF